MEYFSKTFNIKSLRWFFYNELGEYLGSEPEEVNSITIPDGINIFLYGKKVHALELVKSEVKYYILRDKYKKSVYLYKPKKSFQKFCEKYDIREPYFERVQIKSNRDSTIGWKGRLK
jgi:hypothetical protein